MTTTRAHRVPATRSELLKARLDEARAIHDAWNIRLRRAEAQHTITTRDGGDNTATLRVIAATEISVLDAAGELKVALEAWVSSCTNH
ncbi:hypothetical protein SAMN04487917_101377 [Arthrobacter sp. yr096]|uniref:hypothetical protein n=1 Tax=Arthrobacter sp. yr096 TaxID=1761750 RepID=UPI0008B94037|nr:hypothetical protein [Arthrobacter sp. yr096]SEI45396.1 hypothetical protein SAMN04487917_101377 [Arthrobacter sp. yr096]